jgi:hypothetical protein
LLRSRNRYHLLAPGGSLERILLGAVRIYFAGIADKGMATGGTEPPSVSAFGLPSALEPVSGAALERLIGLGPITASPAKRLLGLDDAPSILLKLHFAPAL